MKFEEMKLNPGTLKALGELGYLDATEVQAKAIPPMLYGLDVMVRSQTGTGKTAAFGISLIELIVKNRAKKALVLAPTRELAAQITNELRSIGKHHRMNIFAIYGGTGMGKQVSLLRKGADIVVATPGRLLDHARQGTVRLEQFNLIVLDEADRMLDMGFKPDIDMIMDSVAGGKQVALFSATLDGEVRHIAKRFMKEPEVIEAGEEGKAVEIYEQFIELSRAEKLDRLKELLRSEPMSRTIIFVGSKIGVEKICRKLRTNGIDANYLHGGLSQAQRDRAVRGFHEGSYRILVATDVAARGLHIEDVSHVINYDQADSDKMHTHRIGRTGRMGKGGKAITFVETDPLPKKFYGRGGRGQARGGYGHRPSGGQHRGEGENRGPREPKQRDGWGRMEEGGSHERREEGENEGYGHWHSSGGHGGGRPRGGGFQSGGSRPHGGHRGPRRSSGFGGKHGGGRNRSRRRGGNRRPQSY